MEKLAEKYVECLTPREAVLQLEMNTCTILQINLDTDKHSVIFVHFDQAILST